jgi:hypothetical protein
LFLLGEAVACAVRVVAGPNGVAAGATVRLECARAPGAAAAAPICVLAPAAADAADDAGADADAAPRPLAGGALALPCALAPGASCALSLWLRADEPGAHELTVTLAYVTAVVTAGVAHSVQARAKLACARALELSVELTPARELPASASLWSDAAALLLCSLECVAPSPHQIEVLAVEVEAAAPSPPSSSSPPPPPSSSSSSSLSTPPLVEPAAFALGLPQLELLSAALPSPSASAPVALRGGEAFDVQFQARARGVGVAPSAGTLRVRWRCRRELAAGGVAAVEGATVTVTRCTRARKPVRARAQARSRCVAACVLVLPAAT